MTREKVNVDVFTWYGPHGCKNPGFDEKQITGNNDLDDNILLKNLFFSTNELGQKKKKKKASKPPTETTKSILASRT